MKYAKIGGQAVIEGVMMRCGNDYAVAVRKPDGEIEVKKDVYKGLVGRLNMRNVPIIRGVFAFIDSLVLGMKTLTYSASFYEDEEDEKTPDAKKVSDTQMEVKDKKTPDGKTAAEPKESFADKLLMGATVALSIVLAVGLFMILPFFISDLFSRVTDSAFVLSLIEGVVRVILFLGYLILISRMKDIQRTFMYHGAEHKCINCVEHGLPLTVENVMKSSRQHRRCGTSFLFLVMIVSIFLHFIFVLVPFYWVRLFGRILMVPVVAGISFEMIQWAGRTDSKLADILSKPGLAMQKLTTKEPTEDMAEVAIKAVEAVFDWRTYLKEEFGVDVSEDKTSEAEA